MDVFISWSGVKSDWVAKVIARYLPSLINDAKPWLSSQDISTGTRWSAAIASSLESSQVGITCLTAENQHAPWILFEAGAIAKLTDIGRAMVLRIDLKTTEVTGPLSHFQSVGLDKEGILKLVTDVNAAGPKIADETLLRTFHALWPEMEEQLFKLPSDTVSAKPARSETNLLEEILELVRDQARPNSRPEDLLKTLSEMDMQRIADGERQRLQTSILLNQITASLADRDRALLGVLHRRLGGIIPTVEEIKSRVCEELVSQRQTSAADALGEAKWSRVDGDVLAETELSKMMLPVVINREAEKITIRVMAELGEMSKLRITPRQQKPVDPI